MSPANRERLRKKLTYYPAWKQVGGCLTPVEYVYMVDKFNIKGDWWEPHMRNKVKQGYNRPTWVYFDLDSFDLDRV